MSSREAAQRAVEWMEQQLTELSAIRNATPRDPSFKNWRQATLTLMQRVWPGEQERSERFRRITFSPPDPRAEARIAREWYSRGCKEAERVLAGFVAEIRAKGVPASSSDPVPNAQTSGFENDFPTVDLPVGDLSATSSPSDHAENLLAELGDLPPQGTDPSSPVPPRLELAGPPAPDSESTHTAPAHARPARKGMSVKARLLDLLGLGHLGARSTAGSRRDDSKPADSPPTAAGPHPQLSVMPLGESAPSAPRATPPRSGDPAAPKPVWPMPQRRASDGPRAVPAAPGMSRLSFEQTSPPPSPLVPRAAAIGPTSAPPVPGPFDPPSGPSVTMSRPTTLRTSIEKVSIDSLIDPVFRTPGDDRTLPPDPTPPNASTWPARATPPSADSGAFAQPPAPTAFRRPSLKLVPPVFDDPEFGVMPEPEGGSESSDAADLARPAYPAPPESPILSRETLRPAGDRPPASRIMPVPTPTGRVPAAGHERDPHLRLASEAAWETPASGDPETPERATEAFMRSSPVLGATGRRVQRDADPLGFADPDAIAVGAMAHDLTRLGVPGERQPEVRARLVDLARRLEQGELEWSALRKAMWFAMEYPDVARRLLPVLLPWIDRAA